MHNFDLNASRSRLASEMVSHTFDSILVSPPAYFNLHHNLTTVWNHFGRQSENGDDASVHSNDSMNNNMEVIFLGPNGNQNQSSGNRDAITNSRYPNKYSSCKTLQRKLELKVERAKRNYSQQNGGEVAQVRHYILTYLFRKKKGKLIGFLIRMKDTKSNNASLIPINRLPIPGHTLPLVEYKSDHR